VDDRHFPENPRPHIVRLKAADGHRPRCLLEERPLVHERPVGARAQEVACQGLAEPLHVAALHRTDAIAVERGQRLEVGLLGRAGTHRSLC
jgi:hypothetical protein